MEVVPTPEEEDLVTFRVVTHADGTHEILLEFVHLLGLQLADELVFHAVILLYLIEHLLVPYLFEGCVIHAYYRGVVSVCVSIHDPIPLVVPVDPVEVVLPRWVDLDRGVVCDHCLL